jgi:hypothetical protein
MLYILVLFQLVLPLLQLLYAMDGTLVTCAEVGSVFVCVCWIILTENISAFSF